MRPGAAPQRRRHAGVLAGAGGGRRPPGAAGARGRRGAGARPRDGDNGQEVLAAARWGRQPGRGRPQGRSKERGGAALPALFARPLTLFVLSFFPVQLQADCSKGYVTVKQVRCHTAVQPFLVPAW